MMICYQLIKQHAFILIVFVLILSNLNINLKIVQEGLWKTQKEKTFKSVTKLDRKDTFGIIHDAIIDDMITTYIHLIKLTLRL